MSGASDCPKEYSPCRFSQNSTTEIFSLLRFLRIAPLDNWKVFNTEIEKQLKSVGQCKLKVVACFFRQNRAHFLLDCSKTGHAPADTNI
jgi:SNF2 family DNA or RNA helicase